MNKANMLKTLGAGLALSTVGLAHAQTTEDLYKDLHTKDGNKEISLGEVKSSLTTLSSAPSWTVIKPTDHGLAYDYLVSVCFDPTDSTWVLGGVGGLTVKDTIINDYTPSTSCFPFLSNGFSSYKDGDTLYWGTQDGLVKQSPAGCSVNTSLLTGSNAKISSIMKYQGSLYVATNTNGLYVLDGNGNVSQNYTTTNSSLPTNSITKLAKDNQGNLWATTALGIVKITPSTWTVYTSANTGLSFTSGLKDVAIDNAGTVRTGNVKLFRFSGGIWSEVTVPTTSVGGLEIRGLEVDQFNNLWVATKYDGVLKRDGGTGQWKTYDTTTNPTIFSSNWNNAIVSNKTNSTKISIGIGSDLSGFILLEESTADYLPQLPTTIYIVGEDSIQPGSTYTYHLSATVPQATDYLWSYSGSNVTLTPNDSMVQLHFGSNATLGTLSCKIRNNYTKPINDTLILSVDILNNTVGIANNDFDDKCKVYPNPVTDNICIFPSDVLKSSDEYSCYIYNSTFKLLITSNKQCIDVSNLPNGMYFLRLTNKEGKSSYVKFIKQ